MDANSGTFDSHDRLTSGSESDLSDPLDAPNAPTSSSQIKDLEADHSSSEGRTNPDSSHEDDAVGSDDGDFDMETPPPAKPSEAPDELSSSEESHKQGKRKAGVEQDQHMMNNPELYGLRRSVIPSLICCKIVLKKSL